MPVIADPETMNNSYVEQIVASAKAAIDKAAETVNLSQPRGRGRPQLRRVYDRQSAGPLLFV